LTLFILKKDVYLPLSLWGGKLKHLSMACSLSNIYTKNYWNWTATVEIIIGGCQYTFLSHM